MVAHDMECCLRSLFVMNVRGFVNGNCDTLQGRENDTKLEHRNKIHCFDIKREQEQDFR